MLVFLTFFEVASARSWSVRGVFPLPAFIGSCLTVTHTCLLCVSSRQVSLCS